MTDEKCGCQNLAFSLIATEKGTYCIIKNKKSVNLINFVVNFITLKSKKNNV
jgi:hypothetical protein